MGIAMAGAFDFYAWHFFKLFKLLNYRRAGYNDGNIATLFGFQMALKSMNQGGLCIRYWLLQARSQWGTYDLNTLAYSCFVSPDAWILPRLHNWLISFVKKLGSHSHSMPSDSETVSLICLIWCFFLVTPISSEIGYQFTFLIFALIGSGVAFVPMLVLMFRGKEIRDKLGEPKSLDLFGYKEEVTDEYHWWQHICIIVKVNVGIILVHFDQTTACYLDGESRIGPSPQYQRLRNRNVGDIKMPKDITGTGNRTRR